MKRWQKILLCFLAGIAVLWAALAIRQKIIHRRMESIAAAYVEELFDFPYHMDDVQYDLLRDVYAVSVTLEKPEGLLSFEVDIDEGAVCCDTYGEEVVNRIFSRYLQDKLSSLGIREYTVREVDAYPVRLTREQYGTITGMSAAEVLENVDVVHTKCCIDILECCTIDDAREIICSLAAFFDEKRFLMYVDFSPTGDSEDWWYYSLPTNTNEPDLRKKI